VTYNKFQLIVCSKEHVANIFQYTTSEMKGDIISKEV